MRKGSEILKSMFRSAAVILVTLSLLFISGAGLAEAAETAAVTPSPAVTEAVTETPSPVVTEAPMITVSPAPVEDEEDDFVPPSPEPPEPAKQGHPTLGPTEIPTQTVIDHVNYPKELRDFRFRRDAKLLEIWFPNIRDADAAILTFDGQVYMIDCGDEKSAVRTAVLLQQLGIDHIDIMFNSHLHHDHTNGLALTDDIAKVGEVKICFETGTTAAGELLEQVTTERNIPVTMYKSGDWFTMGEKGEVTLLFLRNYDPVMDMNNQSAVTVVRYKDRSILFTADMEKNERAGADAQARGSGAAEVRYPQVSASREERPLSGILSGGRSEAGCRDLRPGAKGPGAVVPRGKPHSGGVYVSKRAVFAPCHRRGVLAGRVCFVQWKITEKTLTSLLNNDMIVELQHAREECALFRCALQEAEKEA